MEQVTTTQKLRLTVCLEVLNEIIEPDVKRLFESVYPASLLTSAPENLQYEALYMVWRNICIMVQGTMIVNAYPPQIPSGLGLQTLNVQNRPVRQLKPVPLSGTASFQLSQPEVLQGCNPTYGRNEVLEEPTVFVDTQPQIQLKMEDQYELVDVSEELQPASSEASSMKREESLPTIGASNSERGQFMGMFFKEDRQLENSESGNQCLKALILLSDNDGINECLADSDCTLVQLKETILENLLKGDDDFSHEHIRLAVRTSGWIISTERALQLVIKKFAGQELEIVALLPGETLKRDPESTPRNYREHAQPFAPLDQAAVPPASPATSPAASPTGSDSVPASPVISEEIQHGTPKRPKQFYGTGKMSYKAAKEGWTDDFRAKLPPSLAIGDTKADPATKSLLVHFLVEEARAHKNANVTTAEYRIIAQRVVRDHPGYQEKIAGVVQGSGIEALVMSLTKKQQRLEGKDPAKNEVQKGSKKVLVNVKEKNGPYQRAEHGSHKNIHDTSKYYPSAQVTPFERQKKEQMNSLLKAGKTVDFELMTATFNMQRSMIASGPGIVDVQKEWPILFQKQGLMIHFEILTGRTLATETLKSRLLGFEEKIKEVLTVKGYEATFTADVNDVEDLLEAFAMLLFKNFEDYELVYLKTQDDIPIGEISEHPKLANMKHPRIVRTRSSVTVYIDGLTISFDSQFDAMVGMIAAAFVFNYCYPEKAKPFCDFFARYVLEVAEKKAVPESKQLYEKLVDSEPQRRRKFRKLNDV